MEPFPKNKFKLKYSNLAPNVIRNLQALKRTGWVNRDVKNPESVQEHIISTRNLVISEIDSLTEFSSKELEELLDMLEIHDWPESDPAVGDLAILKTNVNEEILRKEKHELELSAMTRICEKLGEKGKIIFELWMRFENGQDSVSSFARQVDKYQAMEKAFEYEQAGLAVSTQEFIEHDEEKIIHPFLLKKLQALKQKIT
ncbi:MAG: HD domain-containing protein [Candidatus Paceibacterota bacterium]